MSHPEPSATGGRVTAPDSPDTEATEIAVRDGPFCVVRPMGAPGGGVQRIDAPRKTAVPHDFFSGALCEGLARGTAVFGMVVAGRAHLRVEFGARRGGGPAARATGDIAHTETSASPRKTSRRAILLPPGIFRIVVSGICSPPPDFSAAGRDRKLINPVGRNSIA